MKITLITNVSYNGRIRHKGEAVEVDNETAKRLQAEGKAVGTEQKKEEKKETSTSKK